MRLCVLCLSWSPVHVCKLMWRRRMRRRKKIVSWKSPVRWVWAFVEGQWENRSKWWSHLIRISYQVLLYSAAAAVCWVGMLLFLPWQQLLLFAQQLLAAPNLIQLSHVLLTYTFMLHFFITEQQQRRRRWFRIFCVLNVAKHDREGTFSWFHSQKEWEEEQRRRQKKTPSKEWRRRRQIMLD